MELVAAAGRKAPWRLATASGSQRRVARQALAAALQSAGLRYAAARDRARCRPSSSQQPLPVLLMRFAASETRRASRAV